MDIDKEENRDRLIAVLTRIAEALERRDQQKPKRQLTAAELAQRRTAAKARYGKSTAPVRSPQRSVARVATTAQQAAGQLVATYCESFKARYHTNPPTPRKLGGQAGQLVRDLGLPRAQELVQAFLQMDDPWFVKRCHDLGVLLTNLNNVAIALANGTKDPQTRNFWTSIFKEGGPNDPAHVSAPDHPDAGQLGAAPLPRAQGGHPVARLPRGR